MKLQISDITIGDRHRKEMGSIALLALSIESVGLLQPIGVTKESVLIFGERRLLACRDHLDWTEIDVRVIDIDEPLHAEHDENELRDPFTPSERVSIADAIRAKLGNRQGQRSDLLPDKSPEVQKANTGESRDIAAEKAGFSTGKQYERAKKVTDHGVPELVEAMDAGRISVSAAAETADLPANDQRDIAKAPKSEARRRLDEKKAQPGYELVDCEKRMHENMEPWRKCIQIAECIRFIEKSGMTPEEFRETAIPYTLQEFRKRIPLVQRFLREVSKHDETSTNAVA